MRSQVLAAGDWFYLPSNTFTREGFTFAGWATSATATMADYSDGSYFYTPGGADVTLYAVWTDRSYTLTFSANGGYGSMRSHIATKGTPITLYGNAFYRTGYAFAGWSTDPAATKAEYTDRANFTMGMADVTLYAVWTVLTHTLTFDANGGTGSMSSLTVAEYSSVTLPANSFTRDGYTFVGWSEYSSASYASYADGENIATGDTDRTLYAVWTVRTHTLSFDANGGIYSMSSQTMDEGTSITLPLNMFSRDYHAFAGWSTDPSATKATYEDCANFTMGTADVTLYAVWNLSKSVNYVISVPQDSTITFSGDVSVVTGDSLSVSVSESYASYQWFLDGTELTGNTGQSALVSSVSLSIGKHALTVFATDTSGEVSSCTLYFTVTQ
jgi:uncharacterized repeat protein (TIGR02543 family)